MSKSVKRMSEAPLKRLRLRAYINVVADLIAELGAGNNVSREWVIRELKKALEETRVEPFRGIRYSSEVYEKELISLYIVATRILRLPIKRFGKVLEDIFSNEICLDKVATVIKKHKDFSGVRAAIDSYLVSVDEVVLSKIIRFITTEYYLDLIDENEALRSISNLVKAYPEFSDRFGRMVKFFIAIVVGSKISSSEIRSRMDLEMKKKALTIALGLSGGAPSNEYIIDVAKIAYGSGGYIKRLSEQVKSLPKKSPT
ncbi:MAG: DUF2192 domain-containing protein [Sulfolobales archaeon]